MSETPRWEFNAANALPVPFAAKVHRWAHIGAIDIASKATRAATGFYTRRDPASVFTMGIKGGMSGELQDLCNTVRTTREGIVSLPLSVLIALLVLLCIALAWWAVERIGVALASWGIVGPGSSIRAFLILPASTPVSLAVSTETALLAAKGWGDSPEERVVGSASGQPSIRSIGPNVSGPSLSPGRDENWILSWGFAGFSAANEKRVKIQ